MIPYKQLSVIDILKDCHNKFKNDKPAFLSLLEQHIDMDELIPLPFRNPTPHAEPLMAPCLPMPLQMLKLNSSTSSCGRMVYIYPEKDLLFHLNVYFPTPIEIIIKTGKGDILWY